MSPDQGIATPAWAVDIKFAAVAGDQPVECGTPIEGLGTTNQAAQLADLRFFVSEVKLRGGATDPECASVFGALGLGGKPQTLFRAIDR